MQFAIAFLQFKFLCATILALSVSDKTIFISIYFQILSLQSYAHHFHNFRKHPLGYLQSDC